MTDNNVSILKYAQQQYTQQQLPEPTVSYSSAYSSESTFVDVPPNPYLDTSPEKAFKYDRYLNLKAREFSLTGSERGEYENLKSEFETPTIQTNPDSSAVNREIQSEPDTFVLEIDKQKFIDDKKYRKSILQFLNLEEQKSKYSELASKLDSQESIELFEQYYLSTLDTATACDEDLKSKIQSILQDKKKLLELKKEITATELKLGELGIGWQPKQSVSRAQNKNNTKYRDEDIKIRSAGAWGSGESRMSFKSPKKGV